MVPAVAPVIASRRASAVLALGLPVVFMNALLLHALIAVVDRLKDGGDRLCFALRAQDRRLPLALGAEVLMNRLGQIDDDRPLAEPHNLAAGWISFDYQAAFGRPVRMISCSSTIAFRACSCRK